MDLWESLKLLATFIVGILGGKLLERTKLRAAELSARVDQACIEIAELEKLALSYWRKPGADTAAKEAVPEIIGRQHRINQLIAFCADKAKAFDADAVIDANGKYYRAVSGGQFDVSDRPAEPQRVREIVTASTALMIALRRARRETLWWKGV